MTDKTTDARHCDGASNDDVTNAVRVWREYDDGYKVRSMTPADALIVQQWYMNMGVISRYDLDVSLSVHPPCAPGFYIGEYKGEVVASAIRIPWGKNIFYGSYYYVDEKCRGLGFGTRLRDEVAREYVGENILCVDAVRGKVTKDNTDKFGYKYAYDTNRLKGVAQSSYDFLQPNDLFKIVSVEDVDWSAMLQYDDEHFVSRGCPFRHAFLRKWTRVDGGATYVAVSANTGDIVGYGSRRPSLLFLNHMVGPLYADSPSVAEALLGKLLSDVPGENVTINISDPNKEAARIVKQFGFEPVFTVNRMHLNGDPHEYRDSVYALTSIDVCGF